MKKLRVLYLLTALFLAGCLTTSSVQQPTNVTRLQMKIAQMEKKLEERDQEIDELKFEIDEMSKQLKEIEDYDTATTVEEVSQINFDKLTSIEPSPVTTTYLNKEIIRVSSSPEEVQTALKNAGYYKGNIDGKIGNLSKQAIKDFQSDHNLEADGIIGKKTWSELKNYLQ